MTRVIANSREALNQSGRARKCPQLSLIARRHRSLQQSLDEVLLLFGRQSAFGPSGAFAGQSRLATLKPRIMPAVNHLPGHLAPPSYFGNRQAAIEHLSRASSSLFHLPVVSFASHAARIRHHPVLG